MDFEQDVERARGRDLGRARIPLTLSHHVSSPNSPLKKHAMATLAAASDGFLAWCFYATHTRSCLSDDAPYTKF